MPNIPINLPNGSIIQGDFPIVIIGPNGSGKTTFGAELARINSAYWIGATRNLQFQDAIEMKTAEAASQDIMNVTRDHKSQPWLLQSELVYLLAKLKAEDSDDKVLFANNHRKGIPGVLRDTKLDKLSDIWSSIFPQREIDFSSYSPKVKARHISTDLFGISRMSGGERVAFYLLAKILDAPSGLIFVDEPEIHFHGVLARKFWNILETFRDDCRFIYITHDLPFAVSRDNVQFIIVKSPSSYVLLEQEHNLPSDLIESILGAATFSISAKRVIFCEGTKEKRWDDMFYTAWFNNEDTVVIPVGSCTEVIKCVEVFNGNPAIVGMQAIGIVDRDFRSDSYLSALITNMHVLQVHEIESLFCLKDIYIALGQELGKTSEILNEEYESLIDEFIAFFNSNLIEKNKIILERVKQGTEWQMKNILNVVRDPSKNISEIKIDYIDALTINNWTFDPSAFFDTEKNKIDTILSTKNMEELLKIFPGKMLFAKVIQKLGITQEVFLTLLIKSLNDSNVSIISILESYLPIRNITTHEDVIE